MCSLIMRRGGGEETREMSKEFVINTFSAEECISYLKWVIADDILM